MAYRTSRKKRAPRKKSPLKPKNCEDLGFSKNLKQDVDAYLAKLVDDKTIPGAAYSIGGRGGIAAEGYVGMRQLVPKPVPLTGTEIYDVASVTKFVVTSVSIMILMERGRLRLDHPVQKFLPDFQGKYKNRVLIQHLLCHTSGLPGWYPLYLSGKTNDKMLQTIYNMELDYKPGKDQQYSCLGFILLGEILRIITEKKIDDFGKKNILEPLHMLSATFNPKDNRPDLTTVPTEEGTCYEMGMAKEYPGFDAYPFRSEMIDGDVHDNNAYAFGGSAGNSGLFAGPRDLAYFAEMILNQGIYAGKRYISPIVVRMMKQNYTQGMPHARGLGLMLGASRDKLRGKLTKGSFGHTGFTGSSLFLDDQNDVFVVFLTNRIHPHVDDTIDFDAIRGEFHSLVWENIKTKRM